MLKGFNPWQIRIAVLGIVGLVVVFLGSIGQWTTFIAAGACLTLLSFLIVLLLGNRQSWRQLNGIKAQLEKSNSPRRPTRAKGNIVKTNFLPNVGESFEYASRVAKNPSQYESFALLNKSVKIRDAFALAATETQYKLIDLLNLVAAYELQKLPSLKPSDVERWDHRPLLALARLLANQRANESDLEDSVRLFKFAHAMFGAKVLSQTDHLLILEALGELQQHEKQSHLIDSFKTAGKWPTQVQLLELNNLNARSPEISNAWVQALNNIYLENGFAPIGMSDNIAAKPIERLTTRSATVENGPLVSIIIPTYQAGSRLLGVLNSLLEQSWKNLEIIIVDDASGPSYEKYLGRASELDPRIRIIRQEQNLGAYCARNAGAAAATGEYITVHDDDDWSHGQKIATQVLHLMNNPDVPGNLTTHTRVTEELKFVRINRSPVLIRNNFSSLMVRRQVFETLGAWDTVNRGADSEFIDRINKYSVSPVATLNAVPLAFSRVRANSLTAGELDRGFLDPARSLYVNAYSQWHEAAGKDPSSLTPQKPRQFPIPTNMQPGKRQKDLGSFDIVFMTDYKFPGGTTSLTLAEIEESAKAGYNIAFIQAASPLNGPDTPIAPKLFKMQLDGLVTQISLQDTAHTKLLVVRHPSVVTFMERHSSDIQAEKVVLIVNNPPMLSDGTGMVFDLNSCIQNTDRMFSTRTIIVAESGVTKALTKELAPKNRLSDSTWPGLIRARETSTPDFSQPPVIGRHSRDHELKWPSSVSEFNSLYTSPYYQTKILGGVDSLVAKLGPDVVKGKVVLEFGEQDVDEFLSTLDFWVYFHDSRLSESFGMSIAEAMSAGKVVILPHYLEASFKEGAVYSRAEDVESLIMEFWKDPERYQRQAKLAKNYALEKFSKDALLSRLETLLQPEATSPFI